MLMSILQGQQPIHEYSSQFKTLLGRLDSFDEYDVEPIHLGLQPELACFVGLNYPKSIAQAVSLAETTGLAVKSYRRPMGKNVTGGHQSRGPSQSNWGRGDWNIGRGRGRGQPVVVHGAKDVVHLRETTVRGGPLVGMGDLLISWIFTGVGCHGHLAHGCLGTSTQL